MRSVRRGARSVIRRQKAAGAGATGTSCPVRPAFEVHPAIQPVPDSELRRDARDSLNLICDLSDWRLGPGAGEGFRLPGRLSYCSSANRVLSHEGSRLLRPVITRTGLL